MNWIGYNLCRLTNYGLMRRKKRKSKSRFPVPPHQSQLNQAARITIAVQHPPTGNLQWLREGLPLTANVSRRAGAEWRRGRQDAELGAGLLAPPGLRIEHPRAVLVIREAILRRLSLRLHPASESHIRRRLSSNLRAVGALRAIAEDTKLKAQ